MGNPPVWTDYRIGCGSPGLTGSFGHLILMETINLTWPFGGLQPATGISSTAMMEPEEAACSGSLPTGPCRVITTGTGEQTSPFGGLPLVTGSSARASN